MFPNLTIFQCLRGRSLTWFIALRYLFSRERQALEWMVTAISILGVAVGVGTIIAAGGVIDGLHEQILSRIVSFVPHLRIYNEENYEQGPDEKLLPLVRAQAGVTMAEPILNRNAVVTIGKGKDRAKFGVQIYAAERIERENIYDVKLPPGAVPLRPLPGQILLHTGSVRPADLGRDALVISTKLEKTALYPVPKALRLKIQQTFESKNNFIGEHTAFMTWEDLRRLSLRKSGIDTIWVRLADPLKAEAAKRELLTKLPKGYAIGTWSEDFKEMFSQMRIFKLGTLLVMLMTIVVAALNIIGTLALIVIQKTREIGILKAMGAPDRLVGRIFLAEGALVGVIGSLSGLALGLGFCALIQMLKLPMPGQWHFVDQIPVQIHPPTVLLVVAFSIGICTLAAAAPASRASRLNPVEALRHE